MKQKQNKKKKGFFCIQELFQENVQSVNLYNSKMQNKEKKFILENMHIVMHLGTTYNTSKRLPPS